MNGPKDRTKKSRDPPDKPKSSRETGDVAGTLEGAATGPESENPWTNASTSVLKERCRTSSGTTPSFKKDVDDIMQPIFAIPGLAEHRFIVLTEYSVLRAFVQNANLLAIDPRVFMDDEALSPWTMSNPYPALMPHDLSPTPLQLSTPHHPYLDMIAPPSLRDNVLLSVMTEEQEEQLCCDMHYGSFTIWGSQPWSRICM